MPRPLSILDLLRVVEDESSSDALSRSVAMAQLAEQHDYERIWFAEHHNAPGLASGAPEIMISHIANATSRIRVGSGGVMLPNQAPLKVAEVFRLLEALHPGRIDLGLGRAPGTDQRTAYALRRNPDAMAAEDYPQNIAEMLAYVDRSFPANHFLEPIQAIPNDVPLPPVWLLGSSGFSGNLAAQLGVGFSFASHINRPPAADVMRAYRDGFQPSNRLSEPHSILAVSVVLGETMEEAKDLSTVVRVGIYRLVGGEIGPSPTLENARKIQIPPEFELRMGTMLANQFMGTPDSVAQEVKALADDAQADEVMLSSWIPYQENQEFVLREFRRAWNEVDV